MPSEKRYYWLKLHNDFFQSKRIKKLRKLLDGDKGVIIYLKMQLKSIESDGVLVYTELDDSFEEELALDIDEDVEDVISVCKFLLEQGLMTKQDDYHFFLPYAQACIGSETQAAERMRRIREQRKQNISEQCSHNVKQCYTEKEIEKEVNRDKKPKTETTIQLYERIKSDFDLSPVLDNETRTWLKYKMEKRQKYSETGLRSLLKKIKISAVQYGEASVCKVIEDSMSSNYQGIVWDKLNSGKYSSRQERISNRVNEVDNW